METYHTFLGAPEAQETVGIGKHHDKSYLWVYRHDPAYARWAVREYDRDPYKDPRLPFAERQNM